MLEDITKDFSDTFEGDGNVKTVYPYRGREKIIMLGIATSKEEKV